MSMIQTAFTKFGGALVAADEMADRLEASSDIAEREKLLVEEGRSFDEANALALYLSTAKANSVEDIDAQLLVAIHFLQDEDSIAVDALKSVRAALPSLEVR